MPVRSGDDQAPRGIPRGERPAADLREQSKRPRQEREAQGGQHGAGDQGRPDGHVDAGFARRFFASALERELLLRPLGNTVYFMPPYVIGPEEIELLARRTADILDALPAG